MRIPRGGLIPIHLNGRGCLRGRSGNSRIGGICFSAATNIIVADFVEMSVLIFALDRFALAVLDGILSKNTKLEGIDLDNLELCLPQTGSDCEESA
jgi:hypothetical protein